MKRIISLTVAVLVTALTALPVMADSIHVGDTTTINNNPSASAAASAAATAGASSTSISNPVQVNTQVNTQSTHVSTEQEQAQFQAQSNKQKQSANNEGINVSTDVPRQAPPAVPAALAVSSLTCYGSWSIAASTPFGGVGAGFPTKDSDCERSRNALIFVNLGMQQVALALLAQNPDNAKAMQAAGVKYPGQVAEAPAPAPVAYQPAPVVTATSEPVSKCGKDMVVTPSGFCRWK